MTIERETVAQLPMSIASSLKIMALSSHTLYTFGQGIVMFLHTNLEGFAAGWRHRLSKFGPKPLEPECFIGLIEFAPNLTESAFILPAEAFEAKAGPPPGWYGECTLGYNERAISEEIPRPQFLYYCVDSGCVFTAVKTQTGSTMLPCF